MTPDGDRARIGTGAADLPTDVDLLVVGLGATGAGVTLDAASRGLSVLAVDAFDVAWGTSRFSSKLVHGGLRYLANGQVGVARESAVERGILMQHTAPHLVRPLPMVMPLTPAIGRRQEAIARGGLWAGDLLRLGARTRRETLPRPRRIGATETLALAPVVRREGLRGALLSWDGQLEDDARLVITIARTAAAYGAHVRTRLRASSLTGTSARLTDTRTGSSVDVRARAVVNATGVWAGGLVPEIALKPSLGTHLVLRRSGLPHVRCAVMAAVPGERNRFVFALPQPDDLFYVGLTDQEIDGEVPDVPAVPERDVDFLLGVLNTALDHALTRDDVVGSFAGLRPLLSSGHAGSTADLSRRHAVLTSASGVVTVVGGKLTTYRRMAEDAVDAAIEATGMDADPCRTTRLPLLGAAAHSDDDRLPRRYGAEAALVLEIAHDATGLSTASLLAPASDAVPVTLAELLFGITHEGAVDAGDLLDRRTRVGLVPADREATEPLAERALGLIANSLQ